MRTKNSFISFYDITCLNVHFNNLLQNFNKNSDKKTFENIDGTSVTVNLPKFNNFLKDYIRYTPTSVEYHTNLNTVN